MTTVALIQTGQLSIADLLVVAAVLVGGVVAWRSKRGDFYKSVAEERGAEATQLRGENERLRHMTDLTPLVAALDRQAAALAGHADLLGQAMTKIADLNGSMRALTTANEALADKLILDESSRALLRHAADTTPRRRTA